MDRAASLKGTESICANSRQHLRCLVYLTICHLCQRWPRNPCWQASHLYRNTRISFNFQSKFNRLQDPWCRQMLIQARRNHKWKTLCRLTPIWVAQKETRENLHSMMRAQGNGLDFVSLFINKLRGDDWLFIISLNIMLFVLQSKHW